MSAVEEWRPIPGHPGYEASSEGRVRSPRGVLKPWTGNAAGHLKVGVGARRREWVHRLIARTFHGECPNGLVVRHLNGQHADNRATNLTYGTQGQNMRDRREHGTDHMVNRTHCDNDHPLTGDNVRTDDQGVRHCRACRRATRRRYYESAGR